mmetsp:Transcript_15330/g.42535  ORF Transcript_15330/g.42535 Transcript_15330/m.42535 type:complete len:511 (+) Transcript_15330:131-1663(+)
MFTGTSRIWGKVPPTKRPNIILRPNEQQRSNKLRTLIRCIAFSPLFFLLVERAFYFPFEDNNNLAGYLDVQHAAITTTIKTKRIDDAPTNASPFGTTESSTTHRAKTRKSLEQITQPFRVTDAVSMSCPAKGRKRITGYHHLGSNSTATRGINPQRQSETRNNRKIPKLFHQQGSSRCVPSALYDLNQQWKGHLLTGDGDDHGRGDGNSNSNSNSNSNNNNEDEEWSIYFHTEDAMTRLFRLIIAAQQQGLNIAKQHRVPLVVANEFPHLGQILRNCVDNGSFSKRLVWRFLCLYIFGGVYADLEYAPPPLSESGATSAILRDSHNDAILFLVPNDDNHQSNSRVEINTNLMAVSPEHPLMYYAVQHLLFLMTTDGYPWSGDDDDDDAAIQHRIVSTVLERALIDFVGDASDNGPVEDGAQQPTPSRGTIYAGTNRRTVSIVGTPGTNVGTATEAEFFETIRKDAETPTEVSTVSGNANQDQGSGGLDGPWGVSPPLCMRKILIEISKPP